MSNSQSIPPVRANCIHYDETESIWEGHEYCPRKVVTSQNLITGIIERKNFKLCRTERASRFPRMFGRCGKLARFFKPSKQ